MAARTPPALRAADIRSSRRVRTLPWA